jgi:hypothetical protein
MGAPGTEFAFTDINDLMQQIRSIIVTGDVVKPAPSAINVAGATPSAYDAKG